MTNHITNSGGADLIFTLWDALWHKIYSDFPWLSAPIVLSLRFHHYQQWFYTASIQNVWYEKQISKTNNSLFQFNAGFSLWNQMISFAYFQLLKIHRCNYHDWNNLESKYCSKKKRKIGWFIINLVSSAKLFLCKINTLSKIKKVYPHRIIEGSVVFHF